MTRTYVSQVVTGAIGYVIACTVLQTAAFADGFRNPPEGAATLGRGGVHLTHVDDASAVTHNPANLAGQTDASVMPALTVGYTKTTYTSPAGLSENTEDPWKFLPSLYASLPIKDSRYVFGIGLHVPYGQSTVWNKDGAFKGVAPHFAEMKTINVSPAVAARIQDNLSVGAALDIMWSDLKFRQLFSWLPLTGIPGIPDTSLSFSGDGYAVGGHVGATWQICSGHRAALTYRAPVSVTYDGAFEMQDLPPAAFLPGPVSPQSDFSTEIDLPSVVALGYGIQASDSVRLEANVEWVQHSRNGSMTLDVGENTPMLMAALGGSTSIPQDWSDTWTFALGGDWQFAPDWTLRAGWTYLPTPIPDKAFVPYNPQGDKNLFGIGLGFGQDADALDISYVLSVEQDRTIQDAANPGVNGKYGFDSHLFSISYRRNF